MKKYWTLVLGIGLVAGLGCNGASTPGGPGATKNATRTEVGKAVSDPANTFRLDAPNTEVDVKQGEKKTIKLGIKRNTNFDQKVSLAFAGVPQGVKVTAQNPEIEPAFEEVQVHVEAAADAALGEHVITVTGTPVKGEKATTTFKIQVNKAG